jgi:uncharacterized protein YacL (UPF0231 family)
MLNFSNLNIHSIVTNGSNFDNSKVLISERQVKNWMSNQEVRATKKNIETAKQSVIEEIKKYYSVESVLIESNGDITIKR